MGKPRLFYFCFAHNRPSGGNKVIYRHVDVLNRHGFEASVLHLPPGFRLTWFANRTRVIDLDAFRRLYDPAADILVLPEDLGRQVMPPGKKVIFNQNVYYGFAVYEQDAQPPLPDLQPEVIAVLVMSEHNRDLLRFAFPHLKIIRIFNAADPQMFRYNPLAGKKNNGTKEG